MLCKAVLFTLGYAVTRATAQEGVFQWGLRNSLTQTTFQECEEVPLIVQPRLNGTSLGVPPYFLIALELGGVPTMTNVGTDPNTLLWKADHKQGANLLLTIVDSQNNDGGVDTPVYTMTKGADTSCIKSPPQNTPIVIANVTETLNTCDPWGLLISGGKKPYTLYLTAANTTTFTMVKMGENDNFYTYINRAAPDKILLASVLDSDNQWAVSSAPVHTAGSTNVDCGGVDSVSGTSPISPSGTTSGSSASATNTSPNRTNGTGNASKKPKNIILIAALATGVGVLLILALGAIFWWRCRRPQKSSPQGAGDMNYEITPWVPPPPTQEMREIDAANHAGKLLEGGGRRSPTHTPLVDSTPVPSVYINDTTPATQSGYLDRTGGSSTSGSLTMKTGVLEDRKEVLPQLPTTYPVGVFPDEQEIIVQHRDATVVVRELPPPYADGPNRPLDTPGSGSSGSRQYQ